MSSPCSTWVAWSNSRIVLFLSQVIPLVAAGIIWDWLLALSGVIDQILKGVGLGSVTLAWLGDFDWALLIGLMTITILPFISIFMAALHPSGTVPNGLE